MRVDFSFFHSFLWLPLPLLPHPPLPPYNWALLVASSFPGLSLPSFPPSLINFSSCFFFQLSFSFRSSTVSSPLHPLSISLSLSLLPPSLLPPTYFLSSLSSHLSITPSPPHIKRAAFTSCCLFTICPSLSPSLGLSKIYISMLPPSLPAYFLTFSSAPAELYLVINLPGDARTLSFFFFFLNNICTHIRLVYWKSIMLQHFLLLLLMHHKVLAYACLKCTASHYYGKEQYNHWRNNDAVCLMWIIFDISFNSQ